MCYEENEKKRAHGGSSTDLLLRHPVNPSPGACSMFIVLDTETKGSEVF